VTKSPFPKEHERLDMGKQIGFSFVEKPRGSLLLQRLLAYDPMFVRTLHLRKFPLQVATHNAERPVLRMLEESGDTHSISFVFVQACEDKALAP